MGVYDNMIYEDNDNWDDIFLFRWPNRGPFSDGSPITDNLEEITQYITDWPGKAMISFGALCNMKRDARETTGNEIAKLLEEAVQGKTELRLSPLLSITVFQGRDATIWCNYPIKRTPAV